MVQAKTRSETARDIVALLPRENCGKCGFGNCGAFALGVIERKASSFGCWKNPSAGYQISKALGLEVHEEVAVSNGYSKSYRRDRRHRGHHRLVHHGHGFGYVAVGRRHRHSKSHHIKLSGHKIWKTLRHIL